MKMYDHHNPSIAKPIIEALTSALSEIEEGWEDGTYGNDYRASVEFETLEGDFVQIYVPNATETDESREEFANFQVLFPYGDETICVELETLGDVLGLFKEGASEAFEKAVAIENKL